MIKKKRNKNLIFKSNRTRLKLKNSTMNLWLSKHSLNKVKSKSQEKLTFQNFKLIWKTSTLNWWNLTMNWQRLLKKEQSLNKIFKRESILVLKTNILSFNFSINLKSLLRIYNKVLRLIQNLKSQLNPNSKVSKQKRKAWVKRLMNLIKHYNLHKVKIRRFQVQCRLSWWLRESN